MLEGLILKGIGGFYYVKTDLGVIECKPRGIFRKKEMTPVAGDKVKISINNGEGLNGVIDEILLRRNYLIRPSVANINQAILVFAVKSPEPDLLLLDKLLIKMMSLKINPLICVNKIDTDQTKAVEIFSPYENAGFNVIFVSARENIGIDKIKEKLKSKISILAGPSGVGKSTIINKLHAKDLMETGVLSEKIERGKHTTRHVELFEVENSGYIADTPGFTSFNIDEIESIELQNYYPEFQKNLCKFGGCSHVSEPECYIKKQLEDGIIDLNRYQRYKLIFELLKKNEKSNFKRK